MTRPNIVWLMADHLAWANRSFPFKLTGFDRVAAEGVAFARAYAACPQCQPVRASMLTGLYPHHHGMVVNDGRSGSRLDFDPGAELFNAHLQRVGYRTAYFGKWHCGEVRLPTDYGFEGWSLPGYGLPYGSPRYADWLERKHIEPPEVEIDWDLRRPESVGRRFRPTETRDFGPFEAAGRILGSPMSHEAYFVTDLACEWLEGVDLADGPFCLRVDVWGPHHPYHSATPWSGSVDPLGIPEHPSYSQSFDKLPLTYEECRRRWKPESRERGWEYWQIALARCYEQIRLVDDAFTRVLDALDRLGLNDSTLVIYTADHGDVTGTHGGLFNKDSLMVEETMSIPLAIRWPGRIRTGGVSHALVTNMDLVPTVLDAADCGDPPLDGASLMPLGADPASADRPRLSCQHHGAFRVEHFQRLLRTGNWKYVAHLDDYDELYDLERDPCELRNLSVEPECGDVLRRLGDELVAEMERTGDDGVDARALIRQLAR